MAFGLGDGRPLRVYVAVRVVCGSGGVSKQPIAMRLLVAPPAMESLVQQAHGRRVVAKHRFTHQAGQIATGRHRLFRECMSAIGRYFYFTILHKSVHGNVQRHVEIFHLAGYE